MATSKSNKGGNKGGEKPKSQQKSKTAASKAKAEKVAEAEAEAKKKALEEEVEEVEEVEENEEVDEEEVVVVEEVEDEEEEDEEDEEDTEDVVTKIVSEDPRKSGFSGFFAKKFDKNENILTIFKSPKIYGAILGEVLGTMFLTVMLLTMGVYMPLYLSLGVVAVTLVVFGLSGAHLNPLVTVGMMATRRVSAIRGVLYILAQILGAWLALLVVNGFRLMGGGEAEMPTMAEVTGDGFWPLTMLEFAGAIMIAFFFARALSYKRKPLAFAMVAGAGVAMASVFAYMVATSFLSLQNTFVINPAAAMMYQVLPNSGADFGEVFGGIMLALTTYAIVPMVGGVIGFYLSDVSTALAGEEEEKCCCCEKKHRC